VGRFVTFLVILGFLLVILVILLIRVILVFPVLLFFLARQRLAELPRGSGRSGWCWEVVRQP
jgi:hypothetical protein